MVNKVMLIGNVGADPEIRVLESGVKMAKFRLATSERYYNAAGEKCEHTEWHSIIVWRQSADFTEKYIRRGAQVYVEGKIRSREVTDPITHNIRTVIEIIGDEVRLLGRRPVQGETEAEIATPTAKREMMPDPDGLPF